MPKSIMSKFWSIIDSIIDSSQLSRHTKNMHGFRWPNLLLQMVFCQPCQTMKVHCRGCRPVNSIIKDVSGAKLLPMTVLAYPMNCVCFCHILMIQHCCLCPNGRYLQLSTHIHYPPPLCTTCGVTVAVKKVTQNSTVSASYQESCKTLAIILL